MSTRIRLRRMGSNKRPFYRVVVADQRSPRDGRFIEIIGKYHPLSDPSLIEIDEQRALHWLRVGAQPSNQVRNLMAKIGIWDTFVSERPSAAIPPKPERGREGEGLEEGAGARRGGGGDTGPRAGVDPGAGADRAGPCGRGGGAGSARCGRGRGDLRGLIVRELVEFLCRELVDDPDAVRVQESFDDRGPVYTVQVGPGELGKVIGRGGRTAKAIRTVVRAAATRQHVSVRVDFED